MRIYTKGHMIQGKKIRQVSVLCCIKSCYASRTGVSQRMCAAKERIKPVYAGYNCLGVGAQMLQPDQGIDSSVPTERKRKEAKQDVQKGKP